MISKSFKDWGLSFESTYFWAVLRIVAYKNFLVSISNFYAYHTNPSTSSAKETGSKLRRNLLTKKNKQTKRGQLRILWTIELINIKSHLLDDLVQFKYSLYLSASSNLFCNPSRKSSMTWRCKIKRANWSNTIKHYVE